MNRFPYRWNLSDGYPAKGVESHGNKVFSTFACGGGSSMGYKLAGYDVIGANDIDPKMSEVYKANHSPKYFFECPISDLLTIDLPKELYELDILDGSPPCSTFSVAGSREKTWKKNKKFREGQSEQVLSDLFFEWIKLVDRLRPRVAIAENVKGMLFGNARLYVRAIIEGLSDIGYDAQLFSLNAATMGVPQKRERVFFVCRRRDLCLPIISMKFNLDPIPFRYVSDDSDIVESITPTYRGYWVSSKPGGPIGKFKSNKKLAMDRVAGTVVASGSTYHPEVPRTINKYETSLLGSFPLDYDYMDVEYRYLIGMSVPPVMMANIADQVYKQLLR